MDIFQQRIVVCFKDRSKIADEENAKSAFYHNTTPFRFRYAAGFMPYGENNLTCLRFNYFFGYIISC